MKLKHNIIYTTLFVIPTTTFANTNSDNLDEIVVDVNADTLQQVGYHAVGTSSVSKVNVPIIDTPTTVNVVTSQLISDRQPDNLTDALSSVSGVSQANTLGGVFDAIQKRGFGGNRDNSIMRNGIQAGPSHNFGATTETIEVLKGPASVLYGIQDPGGIVNVITKKPQQESKHIISGTIGNHSAWGTQFDSTGSLGNGFAYRFIYDKQDKNYWRNFGKIERTTYAPSISWENDKTQVLVAYEHLDYVEPFDRGAYLLTSTGELPDIPITRRLDEPNNETIGKVDNIQVKAEHKLSDTWKLNAAYGYSRALYSYNQARVTQINTTTRTATRLIEQQNNGDQRIHTGSVNLVGEFAIGEIANRFIIGVDATRNYRHIGPIYNTNARGNRSVINIDNPIYTNPSVVEANVNNNAYQYNFVKTAGVFVQDTAYLTEKLIVTGGMRYEYYDQYAGRHPLGGTRTANTDQHGGKLLYQLGSVYKFTPNWAVYANYSESFRPQYSIATPVNSSLKPEEGKSIEVGTKFENAYINATLALFNIDKRNVAESVTNATTGDSEVNIVGKQRSRGVEVDINGYLTEKLSASATYTFTKVKSLSNDLYPEAIGLQLSGVPRHQAALFLSYDLGNVGFGKFRVGGGARYLGSWYAYTSDYLQSYKIPHAVVYDAFIAFDTKISGKNVGLQFNAKNLSDKTYFQSTSGNATGNLIPVSLGYGREFLLTAKVEF
ncbi:TonB-dependent siderophore receptor [Glaesserella sp.]|uniref:TonB-dependent siderophore receptor n=1 Tax=Glaesserella sp. TaxID=2094731 RepID=UPI0035A0672C